MNSRLVRIRKAIMKEVSDIIQKDIKDPRVSGVISITEVDLSVDYRYARIYISIYGSEEQKEKTMDAIIGSTPSIRYEVGKRIRLRHVPELEFIKDDSLERGSRISNLIDKISKGDI